MKPYRIATIATFLLMTLGPVASHGAGTSDWARFNLRPMHRLDFRDLGYPMVNEIPANDSAITSLLTAEDGTIYGGTSGDQGYLFFYNPALNKTRHLGIAPDKGSIHHALVEGADGSIYFGTGKNMFEPIELTPGKAGSGLIDVLLWKDIQNHFKGYEGGHLYRYSPEESNSHVKLPGMSCEAKDLGIPVAGNSVYTITIAPDGSEIYGISYPHGHFFVYNIKSGKSKDLGPLSEPPISERHPISINFRGPERDWHILPRALVCDGEGRVFTSDANGTIVYYSRKTGKIETTDLEVPGDYNHAQIDSSRTVVEYFAKAPSGLIYGGSSDGYLFSLDPAKMKLVNLGKARAARRLRCLAVGANGKVYFMAGEQSVPEPCQCWYYDPQTGGFEELGLILVDRSPYYYWRGYQFDSMTTGPDGTIYLGESERRSHLFLLIPE